MSSHPVWGPPSSPPGSRTATDRHCRLCDVQWHSATGEECWLCGQVPGESRRYMVAGMDVAFPGTLES